MRRFLLSFALAATAAAPLALSSAEAHAAPPYVDRGLTLPRHVWAFDFGLGVGHAEPDPAPSLTGAGLNFDFAVGLTRDILLAFRTGVRLGDDARALRSDNYGRIFDTETFGTGRNTFTNPEARFRWRFVDGEVGEVGLEARAYLPFEDGTRFGAMAGLPIALHLGRSARIDTGVNLPIFFYDRVNTFVSIPLDVWFQPTAKLWLGPISALRFSFNDRYFLPPPGVRNGSHANLLLGFGLGYSVAPVVDLKFQAIFPTITETAGARNFGVGAGVEVRIE